MKNNQSIFKEFVRGFIKRDAVLVESILSAVSLLENENNEILAYHGTNDLFSEFDAEKTQDSMFWFSTNKESIISGDSGAAGTKYIMTCLLSVNNPAGWDDYDKLTTDQLISNGFDSVKLENDFIVFDSNKIKIIKTERT